MDIIYDAEHQLSSHHGGSPSEARHQSTQQRLRGYSGVWNPVVDWDSLRCRGAVVAVVVEGQPHGGSSTPHLEDANGRVIVDGTIPLVGRVPW